MQTLTALFLVVLTFHFARTALGQLYRALPAFLAKREQLAQMLGKTKTEVSTVVDAAGRTVERSESIPDVDAITTAERCRLFLHLVFAS